MDLSDQHYIDAKRWDAGLFGAVDPADALYFTKELKVAGIQPHGVFRVLEIGFGNGSFAGWCRTQGFDYVGVESNEDLLQRASSNGFDVMPALLFVDTAFDEKFDLVVAFDVFEHLLIDDVDRFLKKINSILKIGGLLIGRLPSGDSPFSGFYQYGDITNRCMLGSSALMQLSKATGFEVVQIRAPVLPLRGVGVRRALRRCLMVIGRVVVTRLVRLLFHDNKESVVSANLVFVFRCPTVYPATIATFYREVPRHER